MASQKQTAGSLDQSPVTFDLLPNELVLKIMKMAAFNKCHCDIPNKYNNNFIAGVLGKVSSRFKIIASDKSFWIEVFLDACGHEMMNEVIEKYLGTFTTILFVRLNFIDIRKEKLADAVEVLSSKCLNLQTLKITFPNYVLRDGSWGWSAFTNSILIHKVSHNKHCYQDVTCATPSVGPTPTVIYCSSEQGSDWYDKNLRSQLHFTCMDRYAGRTPTEEKGENWLGN